MHRVRASRHRGRARARARIRTAARAAFVRAHGRRPVHHLPGAVSSASGTGQGRLTGTGLGGEARRCGARPACKQLHAQVLCKGMVQARTVPQSIDAMASLLRSCGGGGGEDGANSASQSKPSRGAHGRRALSAGPVGGRCSASEGDGGAPGAEGLAASCTARSQRSRSARSSHRNCSSRPRLVCNTSLPSAVVVTEQFRSRTHEPVCLPLLYQLISCGATTTCRGFHCLSHSDLFSSGPATQ